MLHAVIMAGGSGTRFWPASRATRPKQLLPVTGGKALLVETANRLKPKVPADQIWVVTNAVQADGVRDALPWLNQEQLLIEPCARNTAACIGLAATAIHLQDPQAVCIFLPADHLIETQEEFQTALAAAEQAASAPGALVTFGIRPTHPATGYGYIRRAGSAIAGGIDLPVWAVDSFTEKPDAETAQRFVDEGIYFWNSGIFAWRADTILSAIAGLMPKLAAGLSQIRAAMVIGDSAATVAEVYPQLESIPIDVGVMEKSNEVLVIEAPFTWRDIGSWGALYDYLEKDENGNAVVFPAGGQLVCEDAANILAYSNDEQTIAVLGLDNVVVVRTKDALLVASRDRAEDVKLLVDRLRRDGHEDLL